MCFIVIVLAILTILLYGSHRYIVDKLFYNLPRGPFPLPFIGAAYLLSSDPRKKPWKEFTLLEDKYGPVMTFYIGQFRLLLLSGQQVIKAAMVSKAKHFSYRPESFMPGYNLFPHGVISSDGEQWLRNRKFCTKGFRDFGLGTDAIVTKVQDEAAALIEELDQRTGSIQNSIQSLLANAVSNVVCCVVFGKRFAYNDPNFKELLRMTSIFLERPFAENSPFFAFPLLARLRAPPQVQDIINIETVIRKMILESIDERREKFNPDHVEDFIDLFIRQERQPKDDELISIEMLTANMRDLFIAGTETTSTALSWTLLYLCKWPQLQRRCHEEIDRVLGTSNRLPTMADRSKLVYVEALMCEILRHVVIVPEALFHSTKYTFNDVGGFSIPPDTIVSYNIWGLHHDAKYWGDPEEFRPERWIDANDGSLLSHANYFMPFGTGPRICLGEALARREYFIFLVSILHRFSVAFPHEDYDVDLETSRHNITHVAPEFEIIFTRR